MTPYGTLRTSLSRLRIHSADTPVQVVVTVIVVNVVLILLHVCTPFIGLSLVVPLDPEAVS